MKTKLHSIAYPMSKLIPDGCRGTALTTRSSPEHVRLETQAVHFSEMMYNGEVHVQLPRTIERVLDIGCGTGILTDMLSEMFPTTECIGLDLSPVPQIRSHQSNVRFFKGNGSTQRPSKWVPEDGAPFTQDRNLFDYIFSRLLILGMSDWPAFIRREFELLKPGGWAELQDLAWDWYDPDGTVVSDSWSWLELMKAHTSKEKGMDTLCGRNCKKWMQYAGFVDVQVIPYLFPFCGFSEATPEMREFGRFNTSTVPMMLQDAIPRAMSGRPSEEVDAIVKEMKETLRPGLGRYQIFYVTVGRKPDADKRSL